MSTLLSPSRGRVFNTRAAAEYCGIAVKTLRNKLSAGEFPEPHKQGRLNGWFQDELDRVIQAEMPDYDDVHKAEASRELRERTTS